MMSIWDAPSDLDYYDSVTAREPEIEEEEESGVDEEDLLLADEWEVYRIKKLNPEASQSVSDECRRAFYAGADAASKIMLQGAIDVHVRLHKEAGAA